MCTKYFNKQFEKIRWTGGTCSLSRLALDPKTRGQNNVFKRSTYDPVKTKASPRWKDQNFRYLYRCRNRPYCDHSVNSHDYSRTFLQVSSELESSITQGKFSLLISHYLQHMQNNLNISVFLLLHNSSSIRSRTLHPVLTPLLVPRSWNSRAILLPTLWATPGL